MKSNIFKAAAILALVVPTMALAQAWTAPTQTAPAGNVSAPLNVSSVSQVKIGGLSVGALISTGSICFGADCKTSWSDVIGAGGVPAGAVMAFDLASCPSGWSDLVSARGRTIVGVGAGSGLTARTLGSTFGAEQHTLTVDEIPGHSHRLYAQNAVETYQTNQGFLNGRVGVAGKLENGAAYMTSNSNGNQLVESTGAGLPHNSMQPSLALLYCRKN